MGGKFDQKEFYDSLLDISYENLLRLRKVIEEKGIDSESSAQFAIGRKMHMNFWDALPKSTAEYVSEFTEYLMTLRYHTLRERDKKTHDESLIIAQNSVVEYAYELVNGYSPENPDSDMREAISSLDSAFNNFKGYIGGDSTKFTRFLALSIHEALSKICDSQELMDESILKIKEKYSE